MTDPVADVARLALAVVFASAATAKLRGRRRFQDVVSGWGIASGRIDGVLRIGVPIAELCLVAALLSPVPRLGAVTCAAFLLLATAAALDVRRRTGGAECGCFTPGPAVDGGIGAWLVLRNAFLGALALTVMLGTTSGVVNDVPTGIASVGLACVVILADRVAPLLRRKEVKAA